MTIQEQAELVEKITVHTMMLATSEFAKAHYPQFTAWLGIAAFSVSDLEDCIDVSRETIRTLVDGINDSFMLEAVEDSNDGRE